MNEALIEAVEQDIHEIARRGVGIYDNRKDFHDYLQEEILELSSKYGFRGRVEFRIPGRMLGTGRNGKIDVVWFSSSGPLFAFEIDSSPRKKSVDKLCCCGIPGLMWVYYGFRDAKSVIGERGGRGLVRLVNVVHPDFVRDSKS